MTELECFRTIVAHLEEHARDYVIVGAVAYNLYGIPRFTKDGDFVLALPANVLEHVLASLPDAFQVDPQARMELFTATTRWVINVTDMQLKMEFFLLGSDPHHVEEFSRRRRAWLPRIELEAWVARPEDLVIQKLRWARNKDLDDVRNILSVQDGALDLDYVHQWTERHGTRARLDAVRSSIPAI